MRPALFLQCLILNPISTKYLLKQDSMVKHFLKYYIFYVPMLEIQCEHTEGSRKIKPL